VPGAPTGVKPSLYNLQVSLLAYKTPSGPVPERHLQNVKCYPIDLASQVDENGNIFIDESTKKPIDVSSLKGPIGTPDKNINVQTSNTPNIIIYWVIFGLVLLLSLAVMIALVVWILPTKGPATNVPIVPTVPTAPLASPLLPSAPLPPV
jgi:hypothetical protein